MNNGREMIRQPKTVKFTGDPYVKIIDPENTQAYLRVDNVTRVEVCGSAQAITVYYAPAMSKPNQEACYVFPMRHMAGAQIVGVNPIYYD